MGVAGGELRSRVLAPSEAKLQFARRPLITGVASPHAFLAASASLNVTYTATKAEKCKKEENYMVLRNNSTLT
jgi:hypothetical protein